MNHSWRVIVVMIALAAVTSCDRDAAPPRAATQPAVEQVVVPAEPATSPSLAESGRPVTLSIDGREVGFPPARLLVVRQNEKSTVLLMSDDPPQAINENYAGNSYYLELPCDELVESLDDMDWSSQGRVIDADASPTGIFLNGNRQQLVPQDLTVRFRRSDGGIAEISGTFSMREMTSPETPPRPVQVNGRMSIKLP